jgi:hypothetical protein
MLFVRKTDESAAPTPTGALFEVENGLSEGLLRGVLTVFA